MKLEYTINTSAEKLLELAFDFDWLKSIDDRLANLEVFEMIDPSEVRKNRVFIIIESALTLPLLSALHQK